MFDKCNSKHSLSIAFLASDAVIIWYEFLFLPCFHNLHPFCPLKANCTEIVKLLPLLITHTCGFISSNVTPILFNVRSIRVWKGWQKGISNSIKKTGIWAVFSWLWVSDTISLFIHLEKELVKIWYFRRTKLNKNFRSSYWKCELKMCLFLLCSLPLRGHTLLWSKEWEYVEEIQSRRKWGYFIRNWSSPIGSSPPLTRHPPHWALHPCDRLPV